MRTCRVDSLGALPSRMRWLHDCASTMLRRNLRSKSEAEEDLAPCVCWCAFCALCVRVGVYEDVDDACDGGGEETIATIPQSVGATKLIPTLFCSTY